MLNHSPIETEKAALRKQLRAELKSITPAERAQASQSACARLEQQPLWHAAQAVLFYAPLPDEVDLWPLVLDALAKSKAVFLPRFNADENAYAVCQVKNANRDLHTGQFGIREPLASCARITSNHLDLILVPGMGFDLNGHRLGRGKGYYDQLLTTLQGPTCGVAFDRQIVSRVPTGPHDVRLSCILTPTRWHCADNPRAVLK